MYTLMKPIQVREQLLERGIRIFTPQDFRRIFRTSSSTTKHFLENQAKQGLFIRLKQGLYTLKTDLPSEEELANSLYKPSYISFEYALAYFNILPEMPYTITCATTKPTRLFTIDNKAFSYRTIKKEAYTGYFLEKKSDRSFYIAEPEKALADYLYFVSLRKSTYSERLLENLKDRGYYRTNGLQKEKLIEYAQLFARKKLNSFIEKIIG